MVSLTVNTISLSIYSLLKDCIDTRIRKQRSHAVNFRTET